MMGLFQFKRKLLKKELVTSETLHLSKLVICLGKVTPIIGPEIDGTVLQLVWAAEFPSPCFLFFRRRLLSVAV